ncbi:MAG: RluA family pseudouridine synthase [Pseudomonadales bacterium]
MSSEDEYLQIQRASVPPEASGRRVDQVAAALFPDYSRSLLARWLSSGALTVDGQAAKPKHKLRGGELLCLDVSRVPYENWSEPQAVDFDCVYEDEHLLVVNKPAGLVVHPGAGNLDGTLVNGLLAWRAAQAELPRAGIVHRLDKDTSGLLLVAASLQALAGLSSAISERQVARRYLALAHGQLVSAVTVDAALGRDPAVPTRQKVRDDGRPAVTHIRPLRTFAAHTLVEAKLETGRTHQIRVHMAHLGHPLIGDERYGGRPRQRSVAPTGMSAEALQSIAEFPRQALHATALQLAHPVSGQALDFEVEAPADFQALQAVLGEAND